MSNAPSGPAGSGPCPAAEVNRRDQFGRTALHLVCSSLEPSAIEYFNALLAHPGINVNLQDHESGWTPLHRALYVGNLLLALPLLRRPDVDLRVKDAEGLSPFDLYNSTVAGTNPKHDPQLGGSDVLAWGANRNYTLGLGDGNDRQLPERIKLVRAEGGGSKTAPAGDEGGADGGDASASASHGGMPGARFDRIRVRDIGMSRMHTVLLTSERAGNVWVCGVGTHGRLGRAAGSMQTRFAPLQDFAHETAHSIAVAQDHTLIVTAAGAVYSFGLNRFAQLGYAVEQGLGVVAASTAPSKGGGAASATFSNGASAGGSGSGGSAAAGELDTQITPRKVVGSLKKETVLGAAASRLHSVVFTADGLFTWGTNTGQLGYDRSATPVQVTPRKVASISQEIKQVAATDFATACLFTNWDVLVLHNDAAHRVQFPLNRFRPEISSNIFRPQQARPKPIINKITSSGTTFAAMSDMGDLFTFALDHPSEYAKSGASGSGAGALAAGASVKNMTPKPQLVWSVRKKFTAVRDVAIASDGSVILCTESGHVFVRARRSNEASAAAGSAGAAAGGAGKGSASKGGGGFKFQAVPYLQRVVKVAMNESGGFAAIKADAACREIKIRGRSLEEALQNELPHLRTYADGNAEGASIAADVYDTTAAAVAPPEPDDQDDSASEEEEHSSTTKYVKMAQLIAEAARRWDNPAESSVVVYGPDNLHAPNGCDMFVIAGGKYIPVHRVILAARVPVLARALEAPSSKTAAADLPQGLAVRSPAKGIVTLALPRCSFHAALFLLHFIYTDELPPVWTASIGMQVERQYAALGINRAAVLADLKATAELLQLSTLTPALNSPVPRAPAPSLRKSLQSAYARYVDCEPSASVIHDVRLHFKDRVVPAHSVVLRRSEFFTSLLHPSFSINRWDEDGVIDVDMEWLRWPIARIVLQHLYVDSGVDVFRGADRDVTQEEFIDFVVEVLAAADHLLLSKLSLICSAVLRRRIWSRNVASILADADFYHAKALKEACLDLCTRNLETYLEAGLLEGLEHKALRDLGAYVRSRQDDRMHRQSAADRLQAMMLQNEDYVEGLDLPKPSLNLSSQRTPRRQLKSPTLSPVDSRRRARVEVSTSSPNLKPRTSISSPADPALMFDMDDFDLSSIAEAKRQSLLTAVSDMKVADDTKKSRPAATPWTARAPTAGTPGASSGPDLRSIMAAERRGGPSTPRSSSGTAAPTKASASTTAASLASELGAINIGPKLSQKDRKRSSAAPAQDAVQSPQAANSSHVSPWQQRMQSKPAGLPAWSTPVSASPPSAPTFARSPPAGSTTPSPLMRAVSASQAPAPSPLSLSSTAKPTNGFTIQANAPVFTPSWATGGKAAPQPQRRLGSNEGMPSRVPSASSPRAPAFPLPSVRSSQGVNGPAPAAPAAALSTTPTSASSFLAIQEQQRKEDSAAQQAALARAAASRKSFAQIIAEEREAERAQEQQRKEAEEFERWFAEESKRVKAQEKKAAKAQRSKARSGPPPDPATARIDDDDAGARASPSAGPDGVPHTRGDGRGRGRGRGGRGRGGGGGGGGGGRGRGGAASGSTNGPAQPAAQSASTT